MCASMYISIYLHANARSSGRQDIIIQPVESMNWYCIHLFFLLCSFTWARDKILLPELKQEYH